MSTTENPASLSESVDLQVGEAAEQFTEDVKAGRAPSIEDYAERYPQIATIIRQVFPALALLDRSSSAALAEGAVDDEGDEPLGLLGDFRLIREIGRGGMGVVYEAEQISLGRRVALKVLPFAAMLDKHQLARFRNEARAAATLDHPNIVAIYSVGAERGVHYYAMQLVEGQSLAEAIAAAQSTQQAGAGQAEPGAETVRLAAVRTLLDPSSPEHFRRVAELGVQAAEALEHAHQNGILHRDVKPANLLVECSHHAPRDETSPARDAARRHLAPRDEKPHHAERDAHTLKLWITDFGLARLESDASLTMTGDLLGTLRYMSPEQALGQRAVIDHRSDVYSLGATLYELLTLQPPFPGDDRQRLLHQIALDDPRPPRQLNDRIPPDLETIVLKAMRKEPEQRYATASALAADLGRLLNNQPIHARPATWREKFVTWSRRHTAALVAAALALLVSTATMLVATVLVGRWYREATLQREEARRQLAETDRQRRTANEAFNVLKEMLTSANPWRDGGGARTVRELLDNLTTALDQQFSEEPEIEAMLRVLAGDAYAQLGVHNEMDHHFQQALVLRRKAWGESHLKVAETLGDYAWALHDVRRPIDAYQRAREAIDLFRRNDQPPWPILGTLLVSVAPHLGDQAEAARREGRTIRDSPPAKDASSPAFLGHVAHSLLRQGRQAEAESMMRSALELQRRQTGNAHPATAWCWSSLGLMLHQQNKLAEAAVAFRESLEIFRRCYGSAHASWQTIARRLLHVLDAPEDALEARHLVFEVAAGCEVALRQRPSDAGANERLAWILATAAIDELRDGRRAVELAEKACTLTGGGEPQVLATLAAAHAEAGDFDAALDRCQQALEAAAGDDRLTTEFTQQLQSYRDRTPWRWPSSLKDSD